ncbi:uracil-DNA glycosylase [Enhygromyxa salina]|uniref:Type-4 uracil-DNA glycosylase n=1 Tax=Enhygromyxa salina TaxID=215803 RepID=A0A2S9YPN2_9BACT|nr:uracil-DNA glycosylase [Enhygromyxa salina]PRQ07055.1 Uracil DNA glycosylase superfamily protein [Enhygromyxa salina]
MSTAEHEGEVEALARAFARHLEHLREFRGVHYVGAAPIEMRRSQADDDDVVAVDDDDGDGEAGHDHASAPAPEMARAVSPGATPAAAPATVVEPRRPQPPDAAPVVTVVAPPVAAAPAGTSARVTATRAEAWPAAKKLAYLRERNVGDCQRCPLAATRQHIVFGVGDPEADLMFVGEAPGADEDRLGEPFVGAAGQRLDRWLAHLGLGRDRVYIANVLKCRPPGNRDPHPVEIDRCAPFLHAQLRAIEPKVIVALGRFAGCLLLGVDAPLYKMRGQAQRYREPKTGAEIPVVVTYHPSYVIRTERKGTGARGPRAQTDRGGVIKSEDQKVLDDLERALSLMRAPTSAHER